MIELLVGPRPLGVDADAGAALGERDDVLDAERTRSDEQLNHGCPSGARACGARQKS